MARIICPYLNVALALLSCTLSTYAAPTSVSANGWTITADPDARTISISNSAFGPLLSGARLKVANGASEVESTKWRVTAERGTLTVFATEPGVAWAFEPRENELQVTTSRYDTVLEGAIPGRSRIPARLMDPAGPQVTWIGTQEVMGAYGGTETRNTSHLPRHNADVMYFNLGQASGRGFSSLFDTATGAAVRFPNGVHIHRAEDSFALRMPVNLSVLVHVEPNYYTSTLKVPFYEPMDVTHFDHAPMVWSSWTSYYEAVREDDIVRNTDWLATHLKPYGFEFVQLDDGYDRGPNGEHYWIENWDTRKFPHGPAWLGGYIKSKGLRAGIWVVPNAYAGYRDSHPEWYVHDKSGKILTDYRTPTLDQTNPATNTFLKRMFETLDQWGFDYYKFDGEFAFPEYVPGADRSKLHDPNANFIDGYRKRLALIRETIGPNRFIEGCVAGTPVNGIGYFNSVFNGHDLYNTWLGMYPLFSSIAGNAFLNRLLVYVMPGEGLELGLPISVEETGRKRPPIVVQTARTREDPLTTFGVTDAEARTLVTFVALTGVAYPLASVMPELPEQRVELLKKTMPTLPIMPADLFSRGGGIHWDTFRHVSKDHFLQAFPEILDLQVNSAAAGNYDVVALTNWRDTAEQRQLDLPAKLSMQPGQPYLAFDFWNQKLLGTFRDRIPVEIGPHDTRVLLIRPVLERPQLLGLSRHISGSYSVKEAVWKASARTLSGVSETAAGDPYTLWVHVPQGYLVERATAAAGRELAVEQHTGGESLSITFPGQATPVKWEIQFAR